MGIKLENTGPQTKLFQSLVSQYLSEITSPGEPVANVRIVSRQDGLQGFETLARGTLIGFHGNAHIDCIGCGCLEVIPVEWIVGVEVG